MNYFATREGVEILVDEHKDFPATKKQQAYIKRLIRTFPEAAELLEYDDYKEQPTRERANEFIRQARENFVESMDQRENTSWSPWTSGKTSWTTSRTVPVCRWTVSMACGMRMGKCIISQRQFRR